MMDEWSNLDDTKDRSIPNLIDAVTQKSIATENMEIWKSGICGEPGSDGGREEMDGDCHVRDTVILYRSLKDSNFFNSRWNKGCSVYRMIWCLI